MFGLIRWVFGLIIAIAITALTILNREEVLVTFSPIHDPILLPLYIPTLALFTFGFTLGSLMIWMSDGKIRREKRKQKRTIRKLEKEIADIEDSDKPVNHNKEIMDLIPVTPESKTAS